MSANLDDLQKGNPGNCPETLLWHVSHPGGQYGPITQQELFQFIASGALQADDLVWRPGMVAWQQLHSIPGLLTPPTLVPSQLAHQPSSAESATTATAANHETRSSQANRQEPTAEKRSWSAGNVLMLFASLIGMGIGGALAKAFGADFGIPALCLLFAFWILKKLRLPSELVPPLAAMVAQGLWFLMALLILMFLLPGERLQALLMASEVFLIGGLLIWIASTQSKASLITLLVYESLGLLTNIWTATNQPLKFALFMHIGLRVFVIASGIYAISKLHSAQKPAMQ